MKMHVFVSAISLLLSGVAVAAAPVVVQPNPVVLPSEPAPAMAPVAPPAAETRARNASPSKAKGGKKQAKVESHPAKKVVKSHVPPKATSKAHKARG
jgi:hypothetical protein